MVRIADPPVMSDVDITLDVDVDINMNHCSVTSWKRYQLLHKATDEIDKDLWTV